MTDDRTLLERAAKAAGIELRDYCTKVATCYYTAQGSPWNPLERDGDALRLAVKLGIDMQLFGLFGLDAERGQPWVRSLIDRHGRAFQELANGDPHAATRRAITRAAASMEPLPHKKE